jgi:FKBP-type peptidyl-prolyl cis-trans isomerase FkpA
MRIVQLRAFQLPTMAALAALLLGACGYPDPAPDSGPIATTTTTTPTPIAGADNFNDGAGKTPIKFPDGLQVIDLKVGTGAVVQAGASVNVQYTGWLSDGTKFDSSRDRNNQTLCAILANVQQTQGNCTPVIPGWNEGVPGMKVGGRRRLTIPSALAYGDQGSPPTIPGKATLVFTIELASIEAQPTPAPSTTPTPSPSPS